ncbi:MAG: histidinol dehydrogenase [Chloroflexi bacterium]|nr:histidinol dehydrogenase [Chloroflexota bacterium]
MKTITGFEAAKAELSRRLPLDSYPVSPALKQKLKELFGAEEPGQAVKHIIDQVRSKGDAALFDLTHKTDGVKLAALEIDRAQIEQAYSRVNEELVSSLKLAAERISAFHRAQKENIWRELAVPGARQTLRPLQRAGVYAPGGTASYPSTVLMTAIPARVAGVEQVVLATPPGMAGAVPAATLVAADIAGVDRVFSIGGAQAIAALAFGTETVPPVDKICGPGNVFVTLAKKMVYGTVDIDGLHGPSEVLVVADDSASPELCAADLLAQAEHDTMASVVLVTTSAALADKVVKELKQQLETLSRHNIAVESLERGAIAVVETLEEALQLADLYAPEHLCLMVENAALIAGRVRNAGCILAGELSSVVLGDYVVGPSHVLPTAGTARFGSPLNVSDFIKLTSIIAVDREELARIGPAASSIARAEGFDGHARAVDRRLRLL